MRENARMRELKAGERVGKIEKKRQVDRRQRVFSRKRFLGRASNGRTDAARPEAHTSIRSRGTREVS
jgi:hypothetical protein